MEGLGVCMIEKEWRKGNERDSRRMESWVHVSFRSVSLTYSIRIIIIFRITVKRQSSNKLLVVNESSC